MEATPVNIVIAHGLEAKALLPMLRLQPLRADSKFKEYANTDGLHLIVTGIGREAMLAAVSYLAEQQTNEDGQLRSWLNIGIAGHREAELGSAWLANKITDSVSGARAYPSQLIEGISTKNVITVDEPEHVYGEDAVYEMEAAAFFEAASRHATAELVQLLKIVSDNRASPISQLELSFVPRWIAQQEPAIVSLIEQLSSLTKLHNASQSIPAFYHDYCQRHHLTVSQKHQLKRLCQRYRALGREAELAGLGESGGGDARQLLARLAAQLERATSPQQVG